MPTVGDTITVARRQKNLSGYRCIVAKAVFFVMIHGAPHAHVQHLKSSQSGLCVSRLFRLPLHGQTTPSPPSPPISRVTPLPSIPVVVYEEALWAMAELLAVFRLLGSPCFPACCCGCGNFTRQPLSSLSPLQLHVEDKLRPGIRPTHRPLGKPEVALSAALGNDALVLLEAAANSTARNGQVAVVARKIQQKNRVSSSSQKSMKFFPLPVS